MGATQSSSPPQPPSPTPSSSSVPASVAPLTLKAHCGAESRRLQSCLRQHKLPTELLDLPPEHPCSTYLLAWQECGRDFLDAISTTRCDDELARFYACKANRRALAADGVEREQLPSCATLELAALSCLGHKVLKRMSTSRGLSAPPPPECRQTPS